MIGTVLGLVRGLLSLANQLTRYLHDQKMIEAGKAQATLKALEEARYEMDKVSTNRARFKRDPEYADRVRKSFKISTK